jgi:spoIIIJ-associated protein
MSGFFSKLFGGGGKKKEEAAVSAGAGSAVALVQEVMKGLVARGHLELSFDVRSVTGGSSEEITVEMSGSDVGLVTEKEGALLDAFQLFIKRVLQHQLPDSNVNVTFDSNGFREESNKELVELAEKLKEKCLEQGRSVYLRALPPKDRKIVHQHLAGDERVRSRSVGDGLFKKIKIYPVKSMGRESGRENDREQDRDSGRSPDVDDPGSELSSSM